MSVTQKQIGERVGVSQSCVARALKGSSNVADETQQKVLAAAVELGYNIHSNGEARALIARRHQRRGASVATHLDSNFADGSRVQTGFIGLVGAAFSRQGRAATHWLDLAEGVQEVLQEEERRVLLLNRESSLGWDMVDGVIVVDRKLTQLPEWVRGNLDCVSLLHRMPGITSIVADDENAGYAAAKYLLGLGHRRIAFLMEENMPIPLRRYRGYLRAMKEAGVTVEAGWLKTSSLDPHPDGYVSWGRTAMDEWLQQDWSGLRCTALIAHNDTIAVGAILALQEACLKVPHDVSVMGFDGTDMFEHFQPQLTTVEMPLREIGVQGAKILMNSIWSRQNGIGVTMEEDMVLPVSIKVGQSTQACIVN